MSKELVIIRYVLTVIVALMALGLVGFLYCTAVTEYRKRLRYKTFHEQAKVMRKTYKEGETESTYTVVGNMMFPFHEDYYTDEYRVYVMYEGKRYCVINETFYNAVNVGDDVRVLVHKGYNKYNKLKFTYISSLFPTE